LNGILALGALAFTVPLAIHLLFRSRFRTVDWGAMHLLESVVRTNHRRIQLLHLLLLLLRCLLPVLLALCLARPVLTGFRSLPGDAPQSLVLAIDDSRSMSARDASGLSRMDRAKQGLSDLLEGLSRRDEVLLVPASRIGSPASAQGAQEAMGDLRRISADHGAVDLGTLVRAAVEVADEASHPQRRILLVGDFPSHTVEESAMSTLARVATTLDEKPIRPAISFWNLGGDAKELENVSVDSLQVNSSAVVAGRGVKFSATIRNAGDTPIRDLRVVWSVDGNELSSTTTTISPRSTALAVLSHRIEQAGTHQVTVSIEHADALIEDNRRSIAIEVIREIRVLLVDGQPSRQPLEGETDFLAVALSPFAFGGEDQPDAVATEVIRPSQISRELSDDSPDILMLANVDQLQGESREAVAQFVLNGGSLVVFDGDNVRPASYNDPWSCGGGSWNLPARLDARVGSPEADRGEPIAIGGRNPNFSAWEVLGEADQQPFADVELYAFRKFSIESPNDSSSDASENPSAAGGESSEDGDSDAPRGREVEPPMSLWSTSGGAPLAVFAKRGRGRVVQFAIPCDTAWSTLPLRTVFLPMMQQLVLELAGSRKQMTVNVGEGFSVPISELSATVPEGAKKDEVEPAEYRLKPPGAPESRIIPNDDNAPVLTVARAGEAGTYRLQKSTPMVDATAIVTSTIRVVEVPAIESQLRDADPSRLAAAAEMVGANVYRDLETLQSDDQTRRYGREIWRWLLAALVVALVGELLLEQRSGKAPKRYRELGAS
jgi:hypothetical protein